MFLSRLPRLLCLFPLLMLLGCPPSGPKVTDADGDGHPAGEDCDDNNASAWEKWCPDTDNDGTGEATPGFTPACGPVAGTAYGWAIGCE